MKLDPAFEPLLASRALFALPAGKITKYDYGDLGLIVLCEVLELNVDAIYALNPQERDRVLEEAKRNIKKWPSLNDVQRVTVNRALVRLQDKKTRKNDGELRERYFLQKRAEVYDYSDEDAAYRRYLPTIIDLKASTDNFRPKKTHTKESPRSSLPTIDRSCSRDPKARTPCSYPTTDEHSDGISDDGIVAVAMVARRYAGPNLVFHRAPSLSKSNERSVRSYFDCEPLSIRYMEREVDCDAYDHIITLCSPHSPVRSHNITKWRAALTPAATVFKIEPERCKMAINGQDVNGVIAKKGSQGDGGKRQWSGC